MSILNWSIFLKHLWTIKNVTLVADVMFVNGVPFLVSSSRYIMLTTIEHAPDRKAHKLGYLIHRIMNTYACAGFNVHTILMDNEFEKIKDNVHTTLNTPATSKHVGEIERRILVIKERCRGIICTLPYAQIPQIMLIYLLPHVVMWLNNFPAANGISNRFSPREILQHNKLEVKYHCIAPFGCYCEVHEDNAPTNSMQSRGLPAICLGPTGNKQGTYSFLNLSTGLVINRRRFVELPAPDSVIQRVNSLADNSGVSSTLVFADRHKKPLAWPDNTPTPTALDPTPMVVYPQLPAEMPEVLLSAKFRFPMIIHLSTNPMTLIGLTLLTRRHTTLIWITPDNILHHQRLLSLMMTVSCTSHCYFTFRQTRTHFFPRHCHPRYNNSTSYKVHTNVSA
jgi:hypothetical protein